MLCSFVPGSISPLSKRKVTKLAFELQVKMNCIKMSLQLSTVVKLGFTMKTFEIFDSSVKAFDVTFHARFCGISSIAMATDMVG